MLTILEGVWNIWDTQAVADQLRKSQERYFKNKVRTLSVLIDPNITIDRKVVHLHKAGLKFTKVLAAVYNKYFS